MFTYLCNKIKKNVFCIILLILMIHSGIIFSLYLNALYTDYSDKAYHICSKLTEYFEKRIQMIEDASVLFAAQLDGDIRIPSSELLSQYSDFLSVNTGISTIFTFNENDVLFYRSSEKQIFQNLPDEFRSKNITFNCGGQWNIYHTPASQAGFLVYIYPLSDANFMAVVPDTNSLLSTIDTYNNSFTDRMGSSLCSIENKVLRLMGNTDASNINLPYSPDIETRKGWNSCRFSIPLSRGDLCIQFQIPLNQLIQNALIIGLIFILISLLSSLLIYRLLSSYSSYLNRELTSLTHKIDAFARTESEES